MPVVEAILTISKRRTRVTLQITHCRYVENDQGTLKVAQIALPRKYAKDYELP